MKKGFTLLMAISLAALTLALYARSAGFPFALIDDSDYVTGNLHVTSGLSLDSLKWAFTSFHASNWHPVTWLSLMLNSQVFGLNPTSFHLCNALLHAASVALFFCFFSHATGSPWKSAFLAACFALHPLHVESVVWITERKDVLSAFFLALTLNFYGAYVNGAGRSRYLLCLASFVLGLMSKPMLVTTPLLLLLLDLWPLVRIPAVGSGRGGEGAAWRGAGLRGYPAHLLVEKLPFFLLSAASCLITSLAQNSAIASLAQRSLVQRVANALWTLVLYLEKTALPGGLAFFYPYAEVSAWWAAASAIFLLGVTLAVLKQIQKSPYLAVGWLWYLISLVPVIGLVQVGNQARADRYSYLPHIGIFIMLAWGGAAWSEGRPRLRRGLLAGAAGALVAWFAVSWVQLGYWSDNELLARHAIMVTRENYLAHFMLGRAYEKQGKYPDAIQQYQEASRINPDFAAPLLNLGSILNNQGRPAEALPLFQAGARLSPPSAEAHYDLGSALTKLGRLDEAISEYNVALSLEPDNVLCHNNIGTVYATKGMLDQAIWHFSRVLQLSPEDRSAQSNLELAISQRGGLQGK